MTNATKIQSQTPGTAAARTVSALEAAAVLGYLAAVAATVTLTALQVARLLVLNLDAHQPIRLIAG